MAKHLAVSEKPVKKTREGSFWKRLAAHWPLLVVLLAAVAIYGHGLHNGFIDDDFSQIVNNGNIRYFTDDFRPLPGSGYHRPLMYLLFTILYKLFGPHPFWFHVVHLVFFLGCLVLIYMLLDKFFRQKLAAGLSMVVAIHPINVDAVAYISHVQDPMFMFFGLAAWLVIDRWRRRRWLVAVPVTLLIAASIGSKETGVLWVIILGLYAFMFKRRLFRPVLVGALAGAGLYGLYLLLGPPAVYSPYHVVLTLEHISLWKRLVSAPAIVWFYLRTFVWPASLNISYEWSVSSVTSPYFWGTLLVDMLFIAASVAGGRFVRRRQPDQFRQYIFFVVWFALSVVVLLQIYPLDITVAERWFLLPMVGLLGAIGTLVRGLERSRVNATARSLITALIIVIVPAMFARSYVRVSNFSSNLNLLRHDVAAHETSYRIYEELADALEVNGQYKEAEYYYYQSLMLRGQDNNSWSGLGNLAIDTNDLAQAERNFKNSLRYDPGFFDGYYNLGILYLAEDRPVEAEQVFKAALKRWPNDSALRARLSETQKSISDASTGN